MCEEERKKEGHTGESGSAGASEGSQSLPGTHRRRGVNAGQSGRRASMMDGVTQSSHGFMQIRSQQVYQQHGEAVCTSKVG